MKYFKELLMILLKNFLVMINYLLNSIQIKIFLLKKKENYLNIN